MSKRKVFTDLFSHDLVFDQVSRINKAKKIVAILKDSRGRLSKLNCLDVGCSSGIITNFLGGYFAKVIGADVDNLAIEKANQRLNHLVDDLLEIARTESGTIELELTKVDFMATVKSVVSQVASIAQEKRVILDEDYEIASAIVEYLAVSSSS